jgi:hypothetical protein
MLKQLIESADGQCLLLHHPISTSTSTSTITSRTAPNLITLETQSDSFSNYFAQAQHALEHFGKSVSSHFPTNSSSPDFCMFIAGTGDSSASSSQYSQSMSLLQVACSRPLIAPAWLVDSLSSYQCLPLDDYLLCRISE